jgi:hydrogenase 2 4Fe-4S ferredoxin-type component
LYRGLALPLVALAGLTFMTYKNMHGDKIAERIAAQKEAMRQARKEMEEAEDEHHE